MIPFMSYDSEIIQLVMIQHIEAYNIFNIIFVFWYFFCSLIYIKQTHSYKTLLSAGFQTAEENCKI